MLDLTEEELKIVLAILTIRFARLQSGDEPLKEDLRSAIEKIAREIGYEEGAINAHIVKMKIKEGKIRS